MASLRAALWLWYRGTTFRGWQRQPQSPTVQEVVEAELAASGILSGLAASGRTDRGVHARQQIASLRVPAGTDLQTLAGRLQGDEWGCAGAALAPAGFHAQWTASTKEYRYRLSARPVPKKWAPYAWAPEEDPRLTGASVPMEAVGKALQQAVGTRDFFAFHAASSIRRPRTLSSAQLHLTAEGLWDVRLLGGGFGRYQVRALVGGAVLVAAGRLSEEAWRAALEEAVRFPGLLAPAHGLVLWSVEYGGRGPFDGDGKGRPPEGPPFEAMEG